MKDFRTLLVWQRSHALVLEIYRVTGRFPGDEAFGLKAQLRRAAASVPTNIAEGCGRGGDSDFARFVQIALGSASETEYHLLLAKDLGYLGDREHDDMTQEIQEVKRMLTGLRARLRRKPVSARLELASATDH